MGKEPYKNLVATILSPRTRDEITYEASLRLFEIAKNFKELSKISTQTLAKTIYPVAFYNTKAANLSKTAKIITKTYGGKVPNTIEALTRLPGVGRKVANIVLSSSFGVPTIAVDTHVHRITNILGWVKTKYPEQTERELTKILPKKYWKDTNRLFVSLGRQLRSKNKILNILRSYSLIDEH